MNVKKHRIGMLILMAVWFMSLSGCIGTIVGTTGSVLFGDNGTRPDAQEPFTTLSTEEGA